MQASQQQQASIAALQRVRAARAAERQQKQSQVAALSVARRAVLATLLGLDPTQRAAFAQTPIKWGTDPSTEMRTWTPVEPSSGKCPSGEPVEPRVLEAEKPAVDAMANESDTEMGGLHLRRGDVLGDYVLLRALGVGVDGVTFEVCHRALRDCALALKLTRAEARFARERAGYALAQRRGLVPDVVLPLIDWGVVQLDAYEGVWSPPALPPTPATPANPANPANQPDPSSVKRDARGFFLVLPLRDTTLETLGAMQMSALLRPAMAGDGALLRALALTPAQLQMWRGRVEWLSAPGLALLLTLPQLRAFYALVQRMDAAGVIHGDLKPGNVVVDLATGGLQMIDLPFFAAVHNGAGAPVDPPEYGALIGNGVCKQHALTLPAADAAALGAAPGWPPGSAGLNRWQFLYTLDTALVLVQDGSALYALDAWGAAAKAATLSAAEVKLFTEPPVMQIVGGRFVQGGAGCLRHLETVAAEFPVQSADGASVRAALRAVARPVWVQAGMPVAAIPVVLAARPQLFGPRPPSPAGSPRATSVGSLGAGSAPRPSSPSTPVPAPESRAAGMAAYASAAKRDAWALERRDDAARLVVQSDGSMQMEQTRSSQTSRCTRRVSASLVASEVARVARWVECAPSEPAATIAFVSQTSAEYWLVLRSSPAAAIGLDRAGGPCSRALIVWLDSAAERLRRGPR